MQALLLLLLLILPACQTVSYHTDADFYACKEEKAAAIKAHDGKLAWANPDWSVGSGSHVFNRCLEGKPMVTENRLGGFDFSGSGQHGTAVFFSTGGTSATTVIY